MSLCSRKRRITKSQAAYPWRRHRLWSVWGTLAAFTPRMHLAAFPSPHSPFFLQLKHLASILSHLLELLIIWVSPMYVWHIHVSKVYFFSFVIGAPAKDLEAKRENYCFLPYGINIMRRLPFTGFPNELLAWDKVVQGQDRCPQHASGVCVPNY